VFAGLEMDISLRRELVLNIKKRLTPQAIKIRADIEVSCFGYEGIDAVKLALTAGEACSTDEVIIKVLFVSSYSLYRSSSSHLLFMS
jgi:translation initiation factor 2 subunit 1